MSIGFTGIQANKDYMFISVNNENTLIWDGRLSVLIHNTYDSERNFHFPNIALTGGCSDENIGFYNADILCQQKKQLPSHCKKTPSSVFPLSARTYVIGLKETTTYALIFRL